MRFHGGCHCGNIAVVFETELSPDAIEIRACQCSFCRKHASRAVADPAGRALISVKEINYLGDTASDSKRPSI
jgi:hypothetical protein